MYLLYERKTDKSVPCNEACAQMMGHH